MNHRLLIQLSFLSSWTSHNRRINCLSKKCLSKLWLWAMTKISLLACIIILSTPIWNWTTSHYSNLFADKQLNSISRSIRMLAYALVVSFYQLEYLVRKSAINCSLSSISRSKSLVLISLIGWLTLWAKTLFDLPWIYPGIAVHKKALLIMKTHLKDKLLRIHPSR